MKDKSNRKKRYILAGIFLGIATLFGIERCVNDEPESVQRIEQKTADKAPSQSSTPHVSSLDKTNVQKDSGRSYCVYNKLGNVSRNVTSINTRRIKKSSRTRKTANGKHSSSEQPILSPSLSTDVSSVNDKIAIRKHEMSEPDNEPTNLETGEHVLDNSMNSQPTIVEEIPKDTSSLITYSFPHYHLFRIGLRAGVGYSSISGLSSIIENYDIRPTFTMSERGGISPRIGVFGTWQYRRLGAELGIDYTRILSKLTEHKIPENVTETTRFHYNFITPQVLLRFYAFPKFYMGAGISAAIPFGSRNIDFTNDRIGEVYRQQAERTQDHLRESVKARVVFIPTIKIGYVDIKNGLEAGLEYGFEFNDMLRTSANDYGYQERMNNLQTVSLTIGYSLPIGKAK
ncbi:outer membrane beta-barrel protein [Prevotella rectalis]|uniref:outer membrane beta-barrel protein n=1 Tax=Prevotella rectalis TaxID=2219999 RepID=UPI001032243B|nr:outer membrane beta-barrel protein [Prevotella brunnea]